LTDPALLAGFEAFDETYRNQLLEDAKRPARPVDPTAFAPKNRRTSDGPSDRKERSYLDLAGRRAKFMDDHQLYREGKLEEQERGELFYVLEQLFE